MRVCLGLLIAGAGLLFFSAESRAFDFTDAQRQLSSLKSAFATEPTLKVEQRGVEPYYDVAVENVCNGAVERLARQWLQEAYWTNFLDRAVLIKALIAFPDSKRNAVESVIFAGGNTSQFGWNCQESAVRGVSRTERARVTLEMIVVSEPGETTSKVLAGALAAAAGLVTDGWGAVVVGVLAGSAKAYADQTRDVTQKFLEAGGRKFITASVDIGATKYGAKRRPTSATVAGASFVDNGEEWLSLRRYPRKQLVAFDPDIDRVSQIPVRIDLVTAYATWDDMLKTARSRAPDLSRRGAVAVFCSSFRGELERSLQSDVLAVRLGLYALLRIEPDRFSGDRATRGCLDPAELKALTDGGYVRLWAF